MNLSRFFVDRPVFATVLSIVIVIVGLIALVTLPITEYPEVVPPTIVVRATYPGASPEVIAETVATPIEQEINGVENMLYMSSQATTDGQMQLTITFELGTDLDKAQVLVENRVAVAEPRLPEEVRRIGVVTQKSSPDLLMVVHLLSPDNRYDDIYIGNYALLNVRDVLSRIEGVGNVTLFGLREYSMRVWLDPERMASLNLTAGDVVQALREQNIQVAAGVIGQPPVPRGNAYQVNVNTLGRLFDEEQFGDIVIKTGADGRITRMRDVARVELGARDYSANSYLDGKPALGIGVFQLPGSNALATATAIRKTMAELSRRFPQGLEYRIIYDPTVFIGESVSAVVHTLLEAFALVFIVVLLFLQDWRATLLPMIDVPVSLIGTFAVMAALGFSLNNLSLFGLVLAIGIVVDDAIVVVENIARWMAKGLDRREATLKAMEEITGPVIAITLVLSAVFIPTAFIGGLSGQFYRQFALTIAASTIISAINALTMAPARAVQLIRPHAPGHESENREALPRAGVVLLFGLIGYAFLAPQVAPLLGASEGVRMWAIRTGAFFAGDAAGWFLSPLVNRLLLALFRVFNRRFDVATNRYGKTVGRLLRLSGTMLLVYGGLIGLTYLGFMRVPVGFIPPQDKGYLIVSVQMPDGTSLERTDAVIRKATDAVLRTPGVVHAVAITGFSGATRSNSSAAGAIFVLLDSFDERVKSDLSGKKIAQTLGQQFSEIQEASIFVFPPPPVQGLGTAGGFKLQVQDRSGAGLLALQEAADKLVAAASRQPGLTGVFTPFRASTPQIYADVDRTKAKMLDVPLNDIFETLQVYLGSIYVNDFNLFGRTYRVTAQAEGNFRSDASDIARLKTRSRSGEMVPLGSLVEVRHTTGPDRVVRYNMFPSAEVNGDTAPGFSSGQAIATMERLAAEVLPGGFGFEWTDLAYQQILAGNTALFVFPLCVLFVFLVLAAQYESWSLPLAVILIVPMCLLSAIAGLWLRGMDNNVLTQIGFVVLVGLASKNAILIVEFARSQQQAGQDRFAAAVEACRLRLRPILMTSLAFILGVLPLVIAEGAGAEMRRSLGTAVFAGMLGVTFFGLFLTPVFYVVIQSLIERHREKKISARALASGAKTVGMLLLLLIPLAGCTVGPNYKEPIPAAPISFANQDQSGFSTLEPERNWWKEFNDETLNRLIELALAGNHDLRIAAARLREARALRFETQLDQFPVVTASGAYTRERPSKAAGPPTGDRDIDLVSLGFDATWELDFFGRVRRSVEARTAEVEAAEAGYRDAMVSLLAEVARNYIELRGAQNQLEVARRNAENQSETLNLTLAVLQGGRGTELDTSRAQAQLNATLATIPPLETAIKAAAYRLAVLTGQQPVTFEQELLKPVALPEVPQIVSIGRPEDLLRRRPDIRVAERNLAAATAAIGVATADLFPRVTFVGSIGLEAASFARLGNGGSDTYFFGPRIVWAAFDLGRVRARIRQAGAQAEAALAEYEKRVLVALEETEDALVNFGRQKIRLDYLRAAAQASEKAAALAHLRYQYGVADFLTVLDAERTLLQAQDQLAQSQTSAATALVAVYKALGGGWR
ncbi:MAG TPA: multidrug efflux RND transporter permease subunit [Candidatus Acidoferrales bacterium]|nr:multidrug efflux RND transporter permease subunit [Candidatus Acidoferrales bacterium]